MHREPDAPRATTSKLFTPAGIATGTVLGSLVAAAMMLWLNYRQLGHGALGNRVAVAGAILYVLLLATASTLPALAWISVLVVAAQAAFSYWIAERLQGAAVRYHRAAGGSVHGLPMSILVGLLAGLAAATLLLMIGRLFGLPIAVAPG